MHALTSLLQARSIAIVLRTLRGRTVARTDIRVDRRSARRLASLAALGIASLAVAACSGPTLDRYATNGTAARTDWAAIAATADPARAAPADPRAVESIIASLPGSDSRARIERLSDLLDVAPSVARVVTDPRVRLALDDIETERREFERTGRIAMERTNLALLTEYARRAGAPEWGALETEARAVAELLGLLDAANPELARTLVDEDRARFGAPPLESASELDLARIEDRSLRSIVERLHRLHVSKPTERMLVGAALDGASQLARLLAARLEDSGARDRAAAFATWCDEQVETGNLRFETLDAIVAQARDRRLDPQVVIRAAGVGAFASVDRRTGVIWPERYEMYLRALGEAYAGIGCGVETRPTGRLVLRPFFGGPAAKGGVRAGDVLLAVDGHDVTALSTDQVVARLVGVDGTELALTLERTEPDGRVERVRTRVTRALVDQPTVLGWRQIGLEGANQPRFSWLADPVARIAYARLDAFREDSARDLRRGLLEAQSEAREAGGRLEGLVLDLRANPGGLVTVAEQIANLFLDDGEVFRSIGRDGRLTTDRASRTRAELAGMPLAILIDDRSASASEVVSGFLQARGAAIVVGSRSFGKGSVQTVRGAPGFAGFTVITTAYYQVPTAMSGRDGGGWREVDRSKAPSAYGVTPDVELEIPSATTQRALGVRGRWFSGEGADRAENEPGATETPDPALATAVRLLRRVVGG